jgi:hypothetical protein
MMMMMIVANYTSFIMIAFKYCAVFVNFSLFFQRFGEKKARARILGTLIYHMRKVKEVAREKRKGKIRVK